MEALKQFGILVGTVVLATYTVRGIDLVINKVSTGYKAAKATGEATKAAAAAQQTQQADPAPQADPGPAAAAAAA